MDAMQIQPGVISIRAPARPSRHPGDDDSVFGCDPRAAPAQTDAAVASPDRFIAMQTSAVDQEQVVDAMRTMYVAATNDDLALFHSVAAPGFYAYDLGKRFAGDELMALIRSRHEAGVVYMASDRAGSPRRRRHRLDHLRQPRFDYRCLGCEGRDLAVLRKEKDVWRIQFFHSTRVP